MGGFCLLERAPGGYNVDYSCKLSSHYPVFASFSIERGVFAEFSRTFDNLVTSFENSSMSENCSITSWYWDFGDGHTSTEKNPVHEYSVGGFHWVVLIATNNYGEIDWRRQHIWINPLFLTSPNGGEVWDLGETQQIEWQYLFNPYDTTVFHPDTPIKLELYDSGTLLGTIAESVRIDAFSYAWTVGDYAGGTAPPGDEYKVRLSVPSVEGMDDISTTCFTITDGPVIVDPTITVTNPEGGEDWSIGNNYTVRWSTTGIPSTNSLKITLVRNIPNGYDEMGVLKRSTDNDGSWLWSISTFVNGDPIEAGDNYRLKFETIVDGVAVYGYSQQFSIIGDPVCGSIVVSSPGGGEMFVPGDQISISWTTEGITGDVKIELRKDNDQSGSVIAENVGSGSSPYVYTVPSDISPTQYFIRVSQGVVKGESGVFTIAQIITKPHIIVTFPGGGETFAVWQQIPSIDWTTYNMTGNVKIELRKADDSSGLIIAENVPFDGSPYTGFVIPGSVAPGDYVIRISQGEVEGESGVFTIEESMITVTSPSGGETFVTGSTMPGIVWSTENVTGYVKIELHRTDYSVSYVVAENVPFDGSPYTGYVIPGDAPSGDYVIQVSQGSIKGKSKVFTIVQSSISVIVPRAGATYGIGFPIPKISWTPVGITGDVRIELRKTDGSAVYVIAENVPCNSSPYRNYVIPTSATPGNYRVRISRGSVIGQSGIFSIVQPTITVTSPEGGEVFGIGYPVPVISWTTTGINLGEALIELVRTDGSASYTVVQNIPYNDSPFSGYIIPDDATPGEYVIRVTVDDIVGESPAFTVVVPLITVTSPAGGESFGIGSYIPSIEWTTVGVQGDVRIKLLRADGRDEPGNFVLAAELDCNASPLTNSLIPDGTVAGEFIVMVNSGIVEGGSNPFSIVESSITVSFPSGGETFYAGGFVPSISWAAMGVTGDVTLLLRNTEGGGEYVLAAAVPADGSPFTDCPIPEEVAAGQYILVVRQNNIEGFTDAFTIIGEPEIIVTSPAGEEQFMYGDELTIAWTGEGIEGDLRIDLVNPDRNLVFPVAEGADFGDDDFEYVIPSDLPRGTYFIRVTSLENESIQGDSEYFTITGPSITVTSPAEGDGYMPGQTIPISWTTDGVEDDVKIELINPSAGAVLTIENGIHHGSSPYDFYLYPDMDIVPGFHIVRISSVEDGNISGDSEQFTVGFVLPSIEVTYPAGDETFGTGDTVSIAWTGEWLSGDVRITLINPDRDLVFTVTEGISCTASPYDYVIPPEVPNGTYFFRIAVVGNESVSDDSEYFSILYAGPSIEVTDPAGGERFDYGEPIWIAWMTEGIDVDVAIYLIESGTGESRTIASAIPYSNTPHEYVVEPDVPPGDYFIRVTQFDNGDIGDDSGIFSIGQPTIEVTFPVGEEQFGNGQTIPIAWAVEGMEGNVRIDLINADRNVVFPVTEGTPAGNSPYNYVIPAGIPQGTYFVRVQKADDESVSDNSEYFTIVQPSITITFPGGNEEFVTGQTIPITWTSVGMEGYVHIELINPDRPQSFPVAYMTPYDNAPYDYGIPADIPSGTYFIRVNKFDDESIYDDSDYFSIEQPSITVVSPAAGDGFETGQTIAVSWTTGNMEGAVRIDLIDADSGELRGVVDSIPYTDSPYEYVIPADVQTGSYFVRVTNFDGTGMWGDSGIFTIGAPSISITYPAGLEVFGIGQTLPIEWSTTAMSGGVRIELINPDRILVYTVAENTPYNGSPYEYIIPSDVQQGSYFIRISKFDDAGVIDDSEYFTIVEPSITVSEPVGGEIFGIGRTIPVRWAVEGVGGDVRIELINPDRDLVYTISESTPSNGSPVFYTIPGDVMPGSHYVRVSSIADETLYGDTGYFTIVVPSITVTAPADGETFGTGQSAQISWLAEGMEGDVIIEMIDSATGETYAVVDTTSHDASPYNYTFPADMPIGTYFIRVGAVDDETLSGDSGTFTIVEPSIGVTTPAGGETFGLGQTISVAWTTAGMTSNVTINLRHAVTGDNYALMTDIPFDGSPQDCVVPSDIPTGDYFIRINTTGDATIYGDSGVFSVIDPGATSITVTLPAGGEEYTYGQTIPITWTTEGVTGNVIIELINPDRLLVYTVTDATPFDNSPFDYTIPGDVSQGTYFVRVRKSDNEELFDDSEYFTIN